MSNWMRGLRRSGLIAIAWCGALALSSLAAYAQNFTITNLTNNSPGTNASYPTMLVDAKGNTYLAWVDPAKGGIVIASQFDGTKFNTQFLVQTAALPAFQPPIAVYLNSGPIAAVEIVWAAVHPGSSPPTYDVFASRSDDSGANFSAPFSVSSLAPAGSGPVALADSPRVGFDTLGRTNVVWGQNGVWISQSQDGMHFGLATSLLPITVPPTPPPNTGGPRVAGDASGNIFVLWTDVANANAPNSYCIPGTPSTTQVGGNFWINQTLPGGSIDPTKTRNLSNTDWAGVDTQRFPNGFFGCSFDNLILFADSQGGFIHLLWSDESPVEDILTSKPESHYPDGSTKFSFPINLASHTAASPNVAVDKNGSFYVVWSGGPNPGPNSQGIFFSRSDDGGGTFTKEVNVAPGATAPAYPAVAVDSNSNVNVAWEQPTKAIVGNGSDMFNVFFARSIDKGATFLTGLQVSTNPSVLCFAPSNPLQTTPDNTTCGTVQLGVDANFVPNMAWVSQASASAAADIDFATTSFPTGSVSPNSASLTASNASANFTVTLNSGFSGLVTFSCMNADSSAPLPSWLTCTFNPPQLNTSQSNTDALTISRVGTPMSAGFILAPFSRSLPAYSRRVAWTVALTALLLMVMLAIVRRREFSAAILMRGFLLMTLTVVLAAGLLSCGGSTSKSTSTGGSGGTGGGNSVTVHVAVLAQSGNTGPTNLGTVTITAQ